MNINKGIVKLVAVGLGGAAVGTTGGVIFATRRCKKKTQTQIKAMQDEMTKLAAALEEARTEKKAEKKEEKAEEKETADKAEDGPSKFPKYTGAPKIYEIDVDEFEDYEGVHEYYQYYAQDDILVDVRESIVDDEWRDKILGNVSLDRPMEDTVYIRNDTLHRVLSVEILTDTPYDWGNGIE